MPSKKLIPVLVLCFALIAGCKKDSGTSDCESLKNALVTNDTETTKAIIDKAIKRLSNREHSSKNLQMLAERMSSRCSITVEVLCFQCEYSLPPFSLLQLKYNNNGSTYEKIIRIRSVSTTDDTMTAWSVL